MVNSRPVFLYVNPRGEARRWDRYNVVPSSTSEINIFKDIDGDGKPEVLFTGPGAVMAYAKPDPANPTAPWKVHNISEPGLAGAHGMGIGDVNGDGPRGCGEHADGGSSPPAERAQAVEVPCVVRYRRGLSGGLRCKRRRPADVVTASRTAGDRMVQFEATPREPAPLCAIMGDFSAKNAGGVTFRAAWCGRIWMATAFRT